MSVPEKRIGRTAYLSFLECELKNNWNQILYKVGYEWYYYKANADSAELWLVRPDGLKRGFRFKEGAQIQIGMMMLKFAHEDMIDEITIDENERAGKSPSSKLNFD
jgi:hypothetical protein